MTGRTNDPAKFNDYNKSEDQGAKKVTNKVPTVIKLLKIYNKPASQEEKQYI